MKTHSNDTMTWWGSKNSQFFPNVCCFSGNSSKIEVTATCTTLCTTRRVLCENALPIVVVNGKRRNKGKVEMLEGADVDAYDESDMRQWIAQDAFGRAIGRGLLGLTEEEGINVLGEGHAHELSRTN